MYKNILFTGFPGCGKSTIIERIVRRMDRPACGFYTREIRRRGRRVGFSISTLDGRHGILAHIDTRSSRRVGRYGVNLQDIDAIAVPSMIPADEQTIVVVDEIGKMECFSELFRDALVKVLDAANTMVGAIALQGDAFIDAVKKRPDTLVLKVTEKNRNDLPDEFLAQGGR